MTDKWMTFANPRRQARIAAAQDRPTLAAGGRDGVLINAEGVVIAQAFGVSGALPEGQTLVEGAQDWPEAAPGRVLGWPRHARNVRLVASDFVDNPGWRAGKSEDVLSAWDDYRQVLRDLPDASPDAAAVVWPEAPR